VAVHANVASVLFDPLHGTSTPTGTLRLVGSGGREVQHVVNVMGRVRSCSPLGAVPGYRPC
jgi:type IV fimbrial biogenesis protein FimT